VQTITGIQIQKKNRRRYSLFLDGEFAFSVSERIAGTLHTGSAISSDRLEAIKSEDEKHRAIEKAFDCLASRPKSRMEMVAYLENKDFSVAAVSHAVTRMEELGYINDSEFARAWVESRLRFRPRGAFGLRYELSSKGVAQTIIDTALEGFDENKAAMRAIDSRRKRWKDLDPKKMRIKILGFLKRRGFSLETVHTIIDGINR